MTDSNSLMINALTVAASQNSSAFHLEHVSLVDLTASVTAANPANLTFTAAVDDVITTPSAHGYTTGMKCTVSTTTTLPAGLAAATPYYFIYVSDTTGKLATSQANALLGTAIDITSTGTGVHTVVVDTTIAGTIKLQKNNEPDAATAIWFDVTSSSQSFTGTTALNWAVVDAGYHSLRGVVTVTSGTVTVSLRANGKARS